MGGKSGKSRNAQMVSLINQYLPKAKTKRKRLLFAKKEPAAPKVAPVKVVPVSRPVQVASASAIAPSPKKPSPTKKMKLAQHKPAKKSVVPVVQKAKPALGKVANVVPKFRQQALNEITRTYLTNANQLNNTSFNSSELAYAATTHGATPSASRKVPALNSKPMAKPAVMPKTGTGIGTNPAVNARHVADPNHGWQIQLGAASTTKLALTLLNKAINAAPSMLADRQLFTPIVKKGNGGFVRARFASFDSKTQAREACSTLKTQGFDCFAIYY